MSVAKVKDEKRKDIGGNMSKKCEEILNKLESEGKIKMSDYQFPPKQPLKLKLKDLLENKVEEKYYLTDEQVDRIMRSNYNQNRRRIQEKDYCDTLCTRDWKDPKCVVADYRYDEGLRMRKNGLSPCLTTQIGRSSLSGNILLIKNNTEHKDSKIRKLTPCEAWRLMGFTDEEFGRAAEVNSNTRLYKQAGNSIVVNVLEAILTNLLIEKEKEINEGLYGQ